MSVFSYLFSPNPGYAFYDSPKVLSLLILCGGFVVISVGLRLWRRQTDPVLKRLSRSWSSAVFWFGLSGLVLIVSRVENISFLSMRFLWVVWIVCGGVYLWFQVKMIRMKYYKTVPQERDEDPREKYLPTKK